MRKEGFNVGAATLPSGQCVVQNSGHGGAGVAASWACASLAADALAAAGHGPSGAGKGRWGAGEESKASRL